MPITNLGEVKAAHDRLLKAHAELVRKEMRAAAERGKEHVNQRPGFKPRTGALQRATRAVVRRTRGGGRVILSNRKPYAAAIDKGARPHVIRARRANYLRFYWPKVGRVVYLRRVHHPGNRTYHFLRSANKEAFRRFGVNARRRMRAIAARF